MGGREVPIHLELNSVASRASHAAIHPTAGSCRSPGDATGGPQPPRGQPRYRGKGKIPRLGQTGERLASTQPSVSLSGWSSWLTGGFLAAASVWALHGGALPGGGAGIPRPWPWPDTGQDASVVGGCKGRGEAMLGHGWQGRNPLKGPDGKPGSHGPEREGPFPGRSTPGKTRRRTDHNLCLKSNILGRFFQSLAALTSPKPAREPPNPTALLGGRGGAGKPCCSQHGLETVS